MRWAVNASHAGFRTRRPAGDDRVPPRLHDASDQPASTPDHDQLLRVGHPDAGLPERHRTSRRRDHQHRARRVRQDPVTAAHRHRRLLAATLPPLQRPAGTVQPHRTGIGDHGVGPCGSGCNDVPTHCRREARDERVRTGLSGQFDQESRVVEGLYQHPAVNRRSTPWLHLGTSAQSLWRRCWLSVVQLMLPI